MYIVEKHMRRRRLIKRISIAIGIVAGIILLGLLIWKVMFPDVVGIERFEWEPFSSDLEDSGTGTEKEDDLFYIVGENPWYNFEAKEAIPEGYLLGVSMSGTRIRMEDTVNGERCSRSRLIYDRAYVVVYNIEEHHSEEYLDLLNMLREKCPGYQYAEVFGTDLNGDGTLNMWFLLENIARKASDEKIYKYLLWNTETEEIDIVDEEDMLYSIKMTPEEESYWEELYAADWDSFYAENGYTEDVFSIDSIAASEGGVFVEVNCENLPQENEMLYDRFPELEKWKGESGKTAKILIGGFPTAEEVMEMFAENAG